MLDAPGLEPSFEELRNRLVYTLHSQAFDWVRMDSTFYWRKSKAGKPPANLTRKDFETYYYYEGPQEKGGTLSFCDRVDRAAQKEGLPRHKQPCDASNFRAVCEVMRTGKHRVYTCHAGITDIALPLFDGDEPVGVWVMGQVLRHAPSDEHFSEVVKKLRKLARKVDLPKLREGYYALPVVRESELRQLPNTLTLAWESMLEHRKRTLLQKQLAPHIKRDIVRDMLAGRIGAVEGILEKAGILHLRGIPTTAVVLELGGTPRAETQSELAARAVGFVEEAMGRFESSVTAAVVPGRIVTLVAARTVRNKAHFRLLLREAAERSCRRIETELGVAAAAGVGTVLEHIGKTPQSYDDAVAEIASAATSRGYGELSGDQAREELMQLGSERVARLGTVSSEEFEELLHRIAVLGARVADENMPWVVGFSCYVVGRVVEGQRMRPAVTTGPVQRIASSTLSRLSRVTDPVAWEECFIEALRKFREILAPNGANRRDAVRAQKAMAFIDANCHRKLSVDEVAAHVYLSKSRFKTVFKQQTGVTCAEYLSQRRLELARGMLGGSPMSIGEIAGHLGFSCSNSFARWFRQVTSVSPREFRQGLSSQAGS